MKKMLVIGGKWIPMPKCILCNRRYMNTTISIFNGRIHVPICHGCLATPHEVERCEAKVSELFAKEPAFNPPEKS